MKQKNLVIAVLAVIVILIAFVVMKNGNKGAQVEDPLANQALSTEDPFDIVFDYYSPWRDAVEAVETSPYLEGLQNEPLLSERLRERIIASETSGEVDPVLCQDTPPQKFTARIVSEYDDMIRILVKAKDPSLTAFATFNIKKHNDGWFIDDIICDTGGEVPPEREFTFEKEGFLLKDVPEPLNSDNWHLIFEEDGEPGHFVPLLFSETTTCITNNGTESTCDPNSFAQATKAHVYGQMTELGAEVSKVEFK